MPTRNCDICSSQFQTKNSRKLRCSEKCDKVACKNQWAKDNNSFRSQEYCLRRKVLKYANCDICGDQFIRRNKQLRCSDRCREAERVWSRHTYNSKPENRVREFIRESLSRSLRYKKDKTRKYIDYTSKQLRHHLEKQFQPGMSWSNYGLKGWHIDHIKPISAFTFLDKKGEVILSEAKKAIALSNLQPLWWYENMRKGGMNRLENRKIYQSTAEGAQLCQAA